MGAETSVKVVVRGESACFPRPEFRRDQISYDVLTPASARGILDRIHWRPAIRWVVTSIAVLKPIAFAEKESAATGGRAVVLRDVAYVIEARFDMTSRAGPLDEAARHRGMFKRRLRAGATVYLGSDCHPAEAILFDEAGEGGTPIPSTRDLGWMVYEADYEDRGRLRFFRAELIDGVVSVPLPGSSQLYG
ncbi:type I-C CRISPR-associated protein Cas5c [Sphingomonas jeddahensis]|uniref:CRISPR-associated protein Cas5 n=1 Tax=Sphingomonas jeddahensis TaxID=1915074 RepID=A0A1V2EUQ1_9SPHN|nr:type I-C CRISPR-associated protein Cas5c [Sphingomonas jeddahensis]ONF96283.1 CRISPR-associated protein Cas5 [Sphingomonas jeddahensis]